MIQRMLFFYCLWSENVRNGADEADGKSATKLALEGEARAVVLLASRW